MVERHREKYDNEVVSRETFKRIFREHWKGFREDNPEYAEDYYDGVIGKISQTVSAAAFGA